MAEVPKNLDKNVSGHTPPPSLINDDRSYEKTKRRKANFRQTISILSGYFLMIAVGINNTWTSPAVPYLTSKDSEFSLTITQASWLVSINTLFGILGCVLGPPLADRCGRKFAILSLGLMILSSMIIIYLANSYFLLLLGRIIIGIGSVGIQCLLPTYVGEVASENVRGRFLIFDKICANIGAFLMNTAGAFLPYDRMNLVLILIPFFAVAIIPLTSETPYYYLMKGKEKEAIAAKMQLAGDEKLEVVMVDIDRMKNVIIEGRKSKESSLRELFSDRGSRKALTIELIAVTTFAFSGYLVIEAYAQDILSQSGSSLHPGYSVMIMAGMQIFAGLPSSQIIDRWGRRPSYLLSGVLCSLSSTSVGIFFFLKLFLGYDVSSVSWLPLVGLISFTFSCNIGLGTMSSVYRGELFSVKVKGLATMISAIISTLLLFASKMLFPLMNDSFGIYTSFWIFGFTCLVGALTVFCVAPETRGKNLEEILEILAGKKKHPKAKDDC